MSEAKQFHLREGTLVEGKSLGCLNVYLASDYDHLKAENERLSKITCVTMGVGNGSGSLFVHGDYESIKAAQAAVIERDTLRKQVYEARELLVAAQELLCLVQEYDGDVFGREHNNATDVNIGITAWLEANGK